MQKWARGGLRVEVDARGGIVVVEFVGLVTRGVLSDFCRDGPSGPASADCLLACFRRATVVADEDELIEVLKEAHARGRFVAPAAILCREQDRALFERYARRAAAEGAVRTVFRDERLAAEWCRSRSESAGLARRMARMSASRSH